ncbi:GntR family transcriptional regulator [Cesiribacter sp. SM1]|uniref:GntR family transcriptional regulator n=1 Tax=Cesiribacter sp. SM1 TaxID=2861196 RepID=UPI001CD45D90|nr:GntR family transcriptional regulator [Cesiribacter sp. SM1]
MSSAPQYQKLQQKLKSQILSGMYTDGDLLPSENELSRTHSLNRVTVRHALSVLEQEGYITKRQGKGSVVQLKRNSLGLLSFKGFTEVVGSAQHTVKTQILYGPQSLNWPAPFFYELNGSESEAGCIYLERLRFADEDAVMLEHTYIPDLDLPAFSSRKLINDSLFATLALQYGVEIMNMEQDVRAVLADPSVAEKLMMEPGSPLIHLYRKYGTNRGNFYIYSSIYCNTQKYAMGSFIS